MKHSLAFRIALLFTPWAALAADRPNVLLILADDLGARDLGCFGSSYYTTPHLDRLVDGPDDAAVVSGFLPHEDHLLDPQEIIRRADPEAPDLRRPRISQKPQLRPRRRTEA